MKKNAASKPQYVRGTVYRCPVCGAEIAVLARTMGRFAPRCCNTEMIPRAARLVFYLCPVCGAEIAVLKEGEGEFTPRCCNTKMRREAA